MSQRLGQHLDLLRGRLITIDYYEVFFAQPAGPAPRTIPDLAQNPLAPHLQTDALGRLRQFVHQPQLPRCLVIAH